MNASELIDPTTRDTLEPQKGKKFYESISGTCAISTRMSLNENMLVDGSFSKTLLQEAAGRTDARAYPVVKGGAAVKAISKDLGIWEDQLLVGNGSDEILDLIAKIFVGRGEALVVNPTFEMYGFYVGTSGGSIRNVLTNDKFQMKASDVLSAITEKTKVIFICSPNNPTGNQHSKDEVLRVVEESEKLVVLDEAYSDFAPYSLARESAKYDNLIVMRTFSKAFGLAGLRVGFAVADNGIIEWLRAGQSPFSVNAVAQEAVGLVLENKRVYESFVKKAIEERRYLMAELQMINGVTPFPSDANFILFRVYNGTGDAENKKGSEKICSALKGNGIEIRDRGSLPLLENCLRVTVSDRESNLRFIEGLKSALREDLQ